MDDLKIEDSAKNDPDPQAWLNERHRPGNWINVRPDEEIPRFIEGWDRTIINMFQMVFTPEIERRRAAGSLAADFFVHSAQLLQPDGRPSIVRFNDEVHGVMRLDLEDASTGCEITVGDFARMVSFDLIEEELDCGHFTLFWTGSGWKGSFDFRNGRSRSAQLIAAALQFVEVARFAARRGHGGPAVDNLFSGCELLCKAQLILNHSPAARGKTHASVSREINSWTRLGNGDPQFVKLFNRLSNERSRARYDVDAQLLPPSEAEFDLAQGLGEALANAVRQKGRQK